MKWQDISTAPKDGTHVLLCVESYIIEGWWEVNHEYWDVATLPVHGCGCCFKDNREPDGWMPLPDPPETP